MSARRRVERRLLEPGRLWRRPRGQTRAALKSVRAIPNPRSESIATPAKQPPIESGHSRNSELPPITQMGADNQARRPAGRLRHGLFPICEYLRHLRLRNSDFGLLSGSGLRSSDFRAAEPDLPSTGRTLEQPCIRIERGGAGYCFGFGTAGGALVALALRSCSSRLRPRRFLKTS